MAIELRKMDLKKLFTPWLSNEIPPTELLWCAASLVSCRLEDAERIPGAGQPSDVFEIDIGAG
jgi:hypothetical protein